MEWLEISAAVAAEAADAVAEVFARWGEGVAVEPKIRSTLDPETCTIDFDEPVLVRTYIPLTDGAEERRRRIEEGLWHLGQLGRIDPVVVRRIHPEDWANAWKEHFHVQRIGRRLVVVPSWRSYSPRPDEVRIDLDPGMAFGSGTHPTTVLCLLALERRVRPGCAVADIGTGSGILAIAAAKLGAARVVAVDIDPVAVEVAEENVRRNRVDRTVAVRHGDPEAARPGGPFDLVVANLTATIIAQTSPALAALLAPEGRLIASGIVFEREDDARRALGRAGLAVVERHVEGDWVLLEAVPATGVGP
ncbi:MAG TPA: 50S ribosomal protein L11 methyltransferase [Chloroflexota bacterium]